MLLSKSSRPFLISQQNKKTAPIQWVHFSRIYLGSAAPATKDALARRKCPRMMRAPEIMEAWSRSLRRQNCRALIILTRKLRGGEGIRWAALMMRMTLKTVSRSSLEDLNRGEIGACQAKNQSQRLKAREEIKLHQVHLMKIQKNSSVSWSEMKQKGRKIDFS